MITQILITSLVCFGIFKATREFMVLHFIKQYGDIHFPKWMRYPLYECTACMGSFWSLVTCLKFGISVDILLIIPAVSGLNYIIFRMFPYSED